MPFLKTNLVTIPLHEDYVKVQNKYKLSATPRVFLEDPSYKNKNSHIVKIGQTTVVMPDDFIEQSLPANFPPNSPYIVSPYDGKLQSQLLPVECEAMGRSIRIVNTSNNLVTLEK